MKKIFVVVIILSSLISKGQSLLLSNNKSTLTSNSQGIIFSHEVPGQGSIFTKTDDPIGFLTPINVPLNLAVNNGPAAVKMTSGNTEHVNYTALGLNAPLIKTKLLTGVTAAFDGSSTSSTVLHGVPDYTKILSVHVEVEVPASVGVFQKIYPEEYTYLPGYQVSYFINGGGIIVINSIGNSFNVRNMPFKVYITYEQ
jgi:hypothetical protein